jgi:hypothetical protein
VRIAVLLWLGKRVLVLDRLRTGDLVIDARGLGVAVGCVLVLVAGGLLRGLLAVNVDVRVGRWLGPGGLALPPGSPLRTRTRSPLLALSSGLRRARHDGRSITLFRSSQRGVRHQVWVRE